MYCGCGNYMTERQNKLHDGHCPDCDDRPILNPRDVEM